MIKKEKERVFTLCVDFDGVIHSYKSGWKGIDVIPDPPNEGAFVWLTELLDCEQFEVNIYSSRSKEARGIKAMQDWFQRHGFTRWEEFVYPAGKPSAFLTIDDRCICFDGTWPGVAEMLNFRPWYKKGEFEPLREGDQPIAIGDEGAGVMKIFPANGHVIMEFGKAIKWFSFLPDDAEVLAAALMRHADNVRAGRVVRKAQLSDPCPHPARKGDHEIYMNAGPGGKGDKKANWMCCQACGANGPSTTKIYKAP